MRRLALLLTLLVAPTATSAAVEIPGPWVFFFDQGSSKLSPESADDIQRMDRIADLHARLPNVNFYVCAVAGESEGMQVARARERSIGKRLKAFGITTRNSSETCKRYLDRLSEPTGVRSRIAVLVIGI